VTARQPAIGGGIQLGWQPPLTGPVTGYRIYRGQSPAAMSLIATTGDTGYVDATAGRAVFYYRITAFNDVGESLPSSLVAMVGKVAAPAGIVNEDPAARPTISSTQLRNALAWRWA
jgi:hypothetical protein